MEKHWELDDEDLMEAFESLPEEEQKRLVAESDRRLEANTEKMRAENELKRQQIEGLERLLAEKQALLTRMRAAAAELDEENARIERDLERVLARVA